MSHTDVHDPYRVKQTDPGWRPFFREWHDHRDGRCDLAEFLAADGWVRTRCTIDLTRGDRNINCGCRMCTGQFGRRYGHRQQRAALRAERRQALKAAGAGRRDDIDIPPPSRSSAW